MRVIESVAQEVGTSPTALSPPLFEWIDLEVLDNLITNSSSNLEIAFHYNGLEVRISGDGTVSVVPQDAASEGGTATEERATDD